MRSPAFKVKLWNESAIRRPERVFRRIDIGLSRRNCRIEPQRNGKRFITAARHSSERRREAQIIRFQTNGPTILGSGILQTSSKFRERRSGVLNALS